MRLMLTIMLLSDVAAFSAASLPTHRSAVIASSARPIAPSRTRAVVALYENDPWMSSVERLPFSGESLDVLLRYGPVVYGGRCMAPGEYNASVRKFMDEYPKISREMAEQEINQFMADGTTYMARTTAKNYKGPKEEDLLPPIAFADKALAIAWVAILIPSASFLTFLSINAPSPPASPYSGLYP